MPIGDGCETHVESIFQHCYRTKAELLYVQALRIKLTLVSYSFGRNSHFACRNGKKQECVLAGVDKVRPDRTENMITSEPLRPISTVPPLLWIVVVSAVVVGVVAAYLTVAAGLPEFVDLKSYQPKTVSEFYGEDGSVLSLYYNERRFLVTLDTVPKQVQNAFVAAEDTRFFSHSGVDPWGIVRALIKDLQTGNFAQGGMYHYCSRWLEAFS